MLQEFAGRSSAPDLSVVAKEFSDLLNSKGLHAALRYLNARTRHRFTGVYRIAPRVLHNICLFDRENPAMHVGSESPLEDTYCAVIDESGRPFAFDNSSGKPFEISPKRTAVVSYCGVPLQDENGAVWGTLCHFDLRPRIVPRAELPIMELLAPMVLMTALELQNQSQARAQ